MAKKANPDLVENPWKFDIGQSVKVAGVAGAVIWRREDYTGARDYRVQTEAGIEWVAEADVSAAEKD